MLSGEWGTVRGMGAIQVGEVGAVQGVLSRKVLSGEWVLSRVWVLSRGDGTVQWCCP